MLVVVGVVDVMDVVDVVCVMEGSMCSRRCIASATEPPYHVSTSPATFATTSRSSGFTIWYTSETPASAAAIICTVVKVTDADRTIDLDGVNHAGMVLVRAAAPGARVDSIIPDSTRSPFDC